jgi:putative transposase
MWCSDTIAHKCCLYPNKEEERKLLRAMGVCRHVYNLLLETYNGGEHSRLVLQNLLPIWKLTDKDLGSVHSKTLQYEVVRLFANLAALKEMKKRGRKVGKPRFKSEHRFRSFTYNQSGFKLLPKNDKIGLLHLSKIGDIPMRMHREIFGKIKQVTIKHMPSGKWYAYIIVDNGSSDFELIDVETAVGLDVGLTSYIMDSDGHEVENPRHLKNALKKLRRDHRRLSKKQKGSNNSEKQRIIVARQYERVQNQRNDFQHKISREYVNNYDLIVTEKLQPGNMVKNSKLARSISDASWSSLNQKLAYKAENASKLFVQVDPRNTSQMCSGCDELVPKTLSDRRHDCPHCGLSLSRDHNASINILERGIEKVRSERPELTLVDIRPLRHLAMAQAGWMKQEAPPARAG